MISWSLSRAWRDGTKGFLLTPYQFIARLAAIVPHPREHQLTYQGVLGPASPLRESVVPRPVVRRAAKDADAVGADSSECPQEQPKGSGYVRWAELLKRVFAEDVLRCPRCHGRRHMISVITDPKTVREVLEGVRKASKSRGLSTSGGEPSSLALSSSPPPEAEARNPIPPRQGRLDFGK